VESLQFTREYSVLETLSCSKQALPIYLMPKLGKASIARIKFWQALVLKMLVSSFHESLPIGHASNGQDMQCVILEGAVSPALLQKLRMT